MPRRKTATNNQINEMSVNADENHPVFVKPVEEYQKRLQYMIGHHAQVFVSHCEARFPKAVVADKGNSAIVNTMRKFKQKMSREGIDNQTGWAREQKGSINQHYHIGIICDGTKVQDARRIGSWLNAIWSREVGGNPESNLVERCNANPTGDINAPVRTGIKIRRNSDECEQQLNDASNWLSYHAKVRDKGKAPAGVREFGFSQIPKKN